MKYDKLAEAIKKYNKIKKDYLAKFGNDSLERVRIPDIIHDNYLGFEFSSQELKRAIETNTPIEQADPELWKKIVF